MGADAEDIGLTIHPHPTLSETIGLAAELFEGTITDLIAPKKEVTRALHAKAAGRLSGGFFVAPAPAMRRRVPRRR